MAVKKIFQHLGKAWYKDEDEKNLTFTEHLEELRYRLIVVFVTVGGCFLALYPFAESLLQIMSLPMDQEQLHMLAPTEAFLVYLKLSIFAAIVISVPMILYQGWAFVAPGLYAKEKNTRCPLC